MTSAPRNLRKDDFYLPTMEALAALGGSGSIDELETALVERFGFTQEELDAVYDVSGSNMLTDKMSWARSYLKLPGFLTNERGVWILTPEGRAAMALPFETLRRQVREAHRARRQEQLAQKAASALEAGADEADDETGATATWNDILLTKLKSIDPAAFERLAKRLLRESGFVKVEVTGKSGDGGIDGAGVLRMNLISFQVLFQCKRYAGSVSAGTVRDFRGAMQGRADKGLIITTGTFTPDARREATRDGAPAIDLIDGDTLCDLLREKGLGVETRQIVTHEIIVRPEFFDDL
jgi:restriction system protein